MKKFISVNLVALISVFCFTSCNNDEDPNDLIWDYVPIHYCFYVHNLEGRNLLDPTTEGNILDKEIYLIRNGEKIEPYYGWPEYPGSSRALPTEWYGIYIAPAFKPYGPDLGNAIYIGEFEGSENEEEFEVMICGNSYEMKFKSHILKDGSPQREYYMNGHEMSNTTWYIRLDENLKDINYHKQ